MTLLKVLTVVGIPLNTLTFIHGIAEERAGWIITLSGAAAIVCFCVTLMWVLSA